MTAEEEQKYQKMALDRISKHANIAGFRSGKIPEKILREQYGEEAFFQEMREISAQKALREVLVQEKIQPIAPALIMPHAEVPRSFALELVVYPEITLSAEYKTLHIPKKEIVVTDAEIDTVLQDIRKRFSERIPVDRPAKMGDFVEIDFFGKTSDGVLIDGASSRMHPVVLGSNSLIPGFEEMVIALRIGEEKTFPITFPQEYHAAHLSGKEVFFTITLRGVFEQKEPEMTPEFIEKVLGKMMPLEEFRGEIQKMLTEKAEDEEQIRRENALLEAWMPHATGDVPEMFLQEEQEYERKKLAEHLAQSGLSLEQFLSQVGTTKEEWEEKHLIPAAKKRGMGKLIIEKLLIEHDPPVSDEEIHQEIHKGDHCSHQHGKEEWNQAKRKAKIQKIFDLFLQSSPPA